MSNRKSLTEFHKQARSKFGVRTVCKECRKIEKQNYHSLPHVKIRAQENYQKNKVNIRERLTVYYWSLTSQYHEYLKSSKKRKLSFLLTKEDCKKFYDTICFYCNDEYKGLGIDRIDNSIGYEVGNVRACCKYCNFMKHSSTEEEFYNRIKKIHNNLKLK